MIKAIAFDGNGVLYHRGADFVDELVGHIAALHLKGLDQAGAAAAFNRWMRASFDGSIGKPEAIGGFLDELGVTEAAARGEIAAKELELSRGIRLFPTERETLLGLEARGLRMGMITNSFQSAREKASWFEGLGLGCAVGVVVSSIDFGASKPDPAIYLEFARRLGIDPGETAFVGHEDFELRGAEAAGMQSVSFNCGEAVAAGHHLNVFEDLLTLVDRDREAGI